MSANEFPDPFQDPDRTVLVPAPGGRRRAVPESGPPRVAFAASAARGEGLNPLVRAANPLLDLVTPLRHLRVHPDVERLRGQLIDAIKTFEAQAKAALIEHEAIAAARYALCTLLDETVSATPWGGGGVWASRSLLVTFHNEAFGGEKFFLILQQLSQDPRQHLYTLELMYLCMALGLEGRYRVLDGGRGQLDTLRERLQQLIQQQRGVHEPDLSPHWKGAGDAAEALWRVIPLWVLAAAAAALLIVVQLFAAWRLHSRSDPVFSRLHGVRVAQSSTPRPAAPVAPRLAGFLADEVARGLVSVHETAERSVVTLRGDGVFASGSADVATSFVPLLQRIGDACATVPGRVIVVGHTDNVKAAISAKFPSNWDLSRGRAEAVKVLLAGRAGPPNRYAVEGRGDTEPLVANDSAANRARNRRVDIIVMMVPPPL